MTSGAWWASSDERAQHVSLDAWLVARFWPKVKKSTGCWEWTGSTTLGYGTIAASRNNKPLYAHRVSFVIHNPNVNIEKRLVLHHCDNRPCVRPDHLFLGSSGDNTRDAWQKGRLPLPAGAPFGETHHSAKLTTAQVKEIRAALAAGRSGVALASTYGVSTSTISLIKRGKKWKSV